ncbi:sigma-E processing peptidase SpoIIGA [Scatolibacter rhodanostii]|uniref:sigma-E processing peptidase SpoIIGA n=1 Tax=Scatolibacter rhodanostii TaxID=2014781 RepID=UPI000C06D327|nr:sigma-E processing peptidase SpoIIGA [Scatolibacter rhodanostii]
MVIYADILFITNLYIDFFLLVCVKNFLHMQVSGLRLLLGSLVGATCSMTALLPFHIPTFLSVLLGAIAAILVTGAAYAPVKEQMFLKLAVCYWFFSFLFAGFFMLVYQLFAVNNLAVIRGVVYLNISPFMLFGLTLLAYIILTLLQKILGPKESDLRFCKIHINKAGKRVTVPAKADTGNALCEPFSGLPVIIVEQDALQGIIPEAVNQFWEGGGEGLLRLIPFDGMGGSGILPAFQADAVYFDKLDTPLSCYIAVCKGKLSSGQFQALFNPDLFPSA